MQELIKKLEKQYKKPISEFDIDDWVFISVNEKLSEDFIKEFQDKVNWKCISTFQELSEDFRQEFKLNEMGNKNIPTGMEFLTYVLEDDTTAVGGISFDGETLNDFLSSVGMSPDAPMNEINESLIECGIKPIKY